MSLDGYQIRPLGDRIVVKLIPDHQSKTIIIPDNAQQTFHCGEVISVGPGKPRKPNGPKIPVEAKPGDIVFFRGMFLDFEKDGLGMITEPDIIGVENAR